MLLLFLCFSLQIINHSGVLLCPLIMKTDNGNRNELMVRLEEVIEKSKTQKEILEKILRQLDMQKKEINDSDNEQTSKNKQTK